MKAPDPSSTVYGAGPLENSWGNDPLNYLMRVFAAFLQTIYETAPRGCFHWTPSLEETEIVITEENPVHAEVIERKPVISIVLGATRFNGSTLDDLQGLRFTDGAEQHTDLLPGNVTLNCMSRVPSEARFLGWNSARTIWNLRKLFIRESCIHELGRNIQIGPVTPAGALVEGDTEGEWHAVAVSVPFFMQWTDTVTPLAADWNGRPIHRFEAVETDLRNKMVALGLPTMTSGGRTTLVDEQPNWGERASTTETNQKTQQLLRPPSIRGIAIRVTQPTPELPAPVFQKTKV